MKFRKKPVVISAVQWGGKNVKEIEGLYIFTLGGVMKSNIGDWVIEGIEGEFYSCDNKIFKKTYEAI